jgi:hypothetical protein
LYNIIAMTTEFDDVAKRAFEIWEREGRPEGRDMEHWLQAENELQNEAGKKQKGRRSPSKEPAALRTPKTQMA